MYIVTTAELNWELVVSAPTALVVPCLNCAINDRNTQKDKNSVHYAVAMTILVLSLSYNCMFASMLDIPSLNLCGEVKFPRIILLVVSLSWSWTVLRARCEQTMCLRQLIKQEKKYESENISTRWFVYSEIQLKFWVRTFIYTSSVIKYFDGVKKYPKNIWLKVVLKYHKQQCKVTVTRFKSVRD